MLILDAVSTARISRLLDYWRCFWSETYNGRALKFWSPTFLCDEKWTILLCREEWEQCLACSGIGERWDIRSSRFLSFSFSVVACSAGVAITEYSYCHPLKHVCKTYAFRVLFSGVFILFSLLKYTILMWICTGA